MPRKPRKPCAHSSCPELTEVRYCEQHQKQIDREYDNNNRPYKKLYKTSRWQRLRIQVLKIQPLCVECSSIGRITKATVVDHIKPHKGDEELFYKLENLQPLCKPCHDRKTAKEDGRWGRKSKVYTY